MKAKATNTEGARLQLEDWDFSGVPQSHLEACCFYEYARESIKVRSAVRAIQKQIEDNSAKGGGSLHVNAPPLFQPMLVVLALTPLPAAENTSQMKKEIEFPNKPWQLLPDRDKERLARLGWEVNRNARVILGWSPLHLADGFPETTTLTMWKQHLKKCNQSRIEQFKIKAVANRPTKEMVGFFALDPSWDEYDLVQEFRLRVRHFRDGIPQSIPLEPLKEPKKRAGRLTYRDALNALGAMRLRFHYSKLSDAIGLMESLPKPSIRPSYRDRTSFNRACNGALKHFQALFSWIDHGSPIHWTEGWGMQKLK